LATCCVYSEDAMTVTSPRELQVNQRDQQNQADVIIAGTVKGDAEIIEARVELSPGVTNGKAVGWTTIAKGDEIDKGNFAGKISFRAGGWYTISIRAC